jgi:hypothetical protein
MGRPHCDPDGGAAMIEAPTTRDDRIQAVRDFVALGIRSENPNVQWAALRLNTWLHGTEDLRSLLEIKATPGDWATVKTKVQREMQRELLQDLVDQCDGCFQEASRRLAHDAPVIGPTRDLVEQLRTMGAPRSRSAIARLIGKGRTDSADQQGPYGKVESCTEPLSVKTFDGAPQPDQIGNCKSYCAEVDSELDGIGPLDEDR